ncbi:FAAR005Wp [Eremothecium gossypii FDAG1]|nr:FAAR005Wp [Eremothecium gossypii FDAG1]
MSARSSLQQRRLSAIQNAADYNIVPSQHEGHTYSVRKRKKSRFRLWFKILPLFKKDQQEVVLSVASLETEQHTEQHNESTPNTLLKMARNTGEQTDLKNGLGTSAPSLVGLSVRDIDDKENPDFVPEKKDVHPELSSQVLEKIHSQSNLSKSLEGNVSVDDLNREGALLTDDNDVDLEQLISKKLDGITSLKMQLKNKRKQQAHPPQGSTARSSGSPCSAGHHHISPENSNSNHSLVMSTDPIDDFISMGATSNSSLSDKHKEAEQPERIRNSYGEWIPNKSHRPHLCRGDSYQKTITDVDERPGRSSQRASGSSAEYLRSLSRSMQRGSSLQRSSGEQLDDKNATYTTNNYTIPQRDVEMAPLIIREDEEDQYKGNANARHL